MTTFEMTIIVLLAAIVALLAWHFLLTRNNYSLDQTKELKRQQDFERLSSQLWGIKAEIGQTNGRIDGFIPWAKHLRQKADNLENAWACDITSIVKRLNELTDIVDKMHRNLCVEIADKMVDRVYPPTYVTPCYAPNGICTNPQRDCINCPKIGTSGTWSTNTTIKAEGEMFQEKFNDSKED